jgi:hypothetical protein
MTREKKEKGGLEKEKEFCRERGGALRARNQIEHEGNRKFPKYSKTYFEHDAMKQPGRDTMGGEKWRKKDRKKDGMELISLSLRNLRIQNLL